MQETQEIIHFTPAALHKVTELLSTAEAGMDGFRLEIYDGGCSGKSYETKVDNYKDNDLVQNSHSMKFYIDPKSAIYLNGMMLDCDEDGEFKFTNPNASSCCDCGKSFSVEQ
jgi:iron-sulfur cluster assembly protein